MLLAAAAARRAARHHHLPSLSSCRWLSSSSTTTTSTSHKNVAAAASKPSSSFFSTKPQHAPDDYTHAHKKTQILPPVSAGSDNQAHNYNTHDAEYDFDRTSVLMSVEDRPGALHEILRYFWKYDINITRLESRPSKRGAHVFDLYCDFEGSRSSPPTQDNTPTHTHPHTQPPTLNNVDALLQALHTSTGAHTILVLDKKEVPFFPRYATQLDFITNRILDAGTDLTSDHPGFSDPVYRRRREELAAIARSYRHGQPIPRITYTQKEIETWGCVYEKQEELLKKYACKEYLEILPLMQEHCGYAATNIPQQEDISNFLIKRTGFRLRPVAGLLSSRDFLNALAFRVFCSTGYIRHESMPLYTPEPDICHELLGHAPMFADRDFAEFSQEIGLASLGASDEDIQKLATCYWHSVEFGVCRQHGELKAYGAGLLSSFGELEWACGSGTGADTDTDTDTDTPKSSSTNTHTHTHKQNKPQYLPWDPSIAQHQAYPITTYQPTYFVASSLLDAKEKMRHYCENLKRPFYARYQSSTESIWIDRAVRIKELEEEDGK